MRVEWNYGRPLQLYIVDYHFQCLPKSLISPVLIHSEYASMVTKPLHFLWLVLIHFCFNQPFFYGISINHLFILFWRVYYVSNHSIFFVRNNSSKTYTWQTGRVLVKNWATLNKLKIGPTVFFSHEKKKKKMYLHICHLVTYLDHKHTSGF